MQSTQSRKGRKRRRSQRNTPRQSDDTPRLEAARSLRTRRFKYNDSNPTPSSDDGDDEDDEGDEWAESAREEDEDEVEPTRRKKRKNPSKVALPPIPKAAAVTLARENLNVVPRPLNRSNKRLPSSPYTPQNVAKWFFANAPRFTANVTHAELAARPKNSEAQISAHRKTIDGLANQPAQAFSCIITDKNGEILAGYLSHRVLKAAGGTYETCDIKHQYEGRTLADLEAMKRAGVPLGYDGIPAHIGVQDMFAIRQPVVPQCDIRHEPDGARTMKYVVEPIRPGVYAEEDDLEERKGVCHLVSSWPAQGHYKKDRQDNQLFVSAEFIGQSSTATMSAEWLTTVMEAITLWLVPYFKLMFPEGYKRYKRAFQAGRWSPMDPGPWLGKAIVYKLQVEIHQDSDDGGPTACFPMGYYSGGAMHLPDLGAKFLYQPGDAFIMLAGDLYHAVEKWEPVPMTEEMRMKELTPGRIGTVLFSSKRAVETLVTKPSNWMRRTAGGMLPDSLGQF